MNKISIDTNALEFIISSLDKKINDIDTKFKYIENEVKKIDGTTNIWQSETQRTVHNKYLTISKKFPEIKTQLENYSKFLKKTIVNYKTGEESINNDISINSKDLNVN